MHLSTLFVYWYGTLTKRTSCVNDFIVGSNPSSRKINGSSEVVSSIVKQEDGVEGMQNEPWAVLAHKKPKKGWIPYNPRIMRPKPLSKDTKSVKILSWNVNGLRALLKGSSAVELAEREDFDILCLQETKLQASRLIPISLQHLVNSIIYNGKVSNFLFLD